MAESRGGKGFTFVLLTAIAAGLFAEAIGLHMILGAYLAGLFFEEKVAHPNLVTIVQDRSYGIAYSFLGPIFFISLGFSITFDISASELLFVALLTTAVIVGQILSAGGMALRIGLPVREALTVGVGMCGRAEIAFILASLALAQGAIDQSVFTILIFTAFLLNLFTPMALKGCAVLLEGKAALDAAGTRGVKQIDKFSTPLGEEGFDGQLLHTLPVLEGAVVIYGYGPEVATLINELKSRDLPMVVIEEREDVARRLHERGELVVHATMADEALDVRPLGEARALVANGTDDSNALFALSAREHGFAGPIVAMIANPNRREPMLLAGVSAAFIPAFVLAAAIAVRASTRISPRIVGLEPLGSLLEVAELRVHSASLLANRSLAASRIRTETGANIVGQWIEDELRSPPPANQPLDPGIILVAAGSPESIRNLSALTRPIAQQGPIVVAGFGEVGQKIAQLLTDAGEDLCVIDAQERPGVDIVGEVLHDGVLARASVAAARVVILALDSDNAALVATTVVRSFAPDVPIIAGVSQVESVGRIQQAGADFAISVSQVAGQILAHHVLGETVSLQPRIKLAKRVPGSLVGRSPLTARIRERTGCTVVAIERKGEILMDIPPSLVLSEEDALYLCGTPYAFNRYYNEFPAVLV